MTRKTDVMHETDWAPSTEVQFTFLAVISAWAIAAAVLEMSMHFIIG